MLVKPERPRYGFRVSGPLFIILNKRGVVYEVTVRNIAGKETIKEE